MNLTLKQVYSYSAENVIFHNFLLATIGCISVIMWAILSSKCNPLKLLNIRSTIFISFFLIFPILLSSSTDYRFIFLWQAILAFFFLGDLPGTSIFISSFPVLKRFSTVSLVFAVTRALMYIFTSFGLVYLTEWFGHYGLWILVLPVATAYLWGVNHFVKLEKASGNFSSSKKTDGLIIKC